MFFSILLILFTVLGSGSASDSVHLESSEALVDDMGDIDEVSLESSEALVDDMGDIDEVSLESSDEALLNEQNLNDDKELVSEDGSSNEKISSGSLDSSFEGNVLSGSLDGSSKDINSSNSKKFSNKNSTVECSPLTTEYTAGKIYYKVKAYNVLNFGGENYIEPLYNSTIKLRVYTGTKYKDYYGTIANDGIASIKIAKLSLGSHKIDIYVANKKRATSSIKVTKAKAKVLAPSKIVKFKKNTNFKIKVLDSLNNPIKNIRLKVNVFSVNKSKTYAVKTNSKGLAKLRINNLTLGKHKLVITTKNKNYKINKSSMIWVRKNITGKQAEKLKVSAPSKTVKYNQSSYFNITVLNSYNDPVKKLTLKIKVFSANKSKTYTIKTNSKGIAKLQTRKLDIGTHNITIKTSNKSYILNKSSKIKVNKTLASNKIDCPKLISLMYYPQDDEYYAQLTFSSKKGSEYQILRKGADAYEIISVIKADSNKTSFFNKVNNDFLYTYSVREILKVNGENVLSYYDPEGLKLINRTKVTVDFQNLKADVHWEKVSNATKYRVFRKMGRNGTYECIAVVDSKKTNYEDVYYKSAKELSVILNDKTFSEASFNNLFYTVRACYNNSVNGFEKTSYGLYYKDGDFNLESPTIVSLRDNTIKWGKVPNADGYIVLKRNSASDEWEEVAQAMQKTSTVISMNLDEIDRNAYYAVKAFASKNGEVVYSKFDEGFSLRNYDEENSKYKLLYFGDSITYGSPYKSPSSRHIFSIPHRVSQLLGCSYYNPSIPGSTYHDLGQMDGVNIENTNYYRYRICREVVDQIAIGELPANWEDLDTSKNSEGETNTRIDDYNIVVLAAGTNDYIDNSILGSEDSNDTFTFNGAFNHIMEKIGEASQKRIERGEEAIKVIFVDLYYSDRTYDIKQRVNRDITPNKIGLTLNDYQDALWAQYNKWQSQSDGILSFYNFKTREYDIVNSDNSPYTASDNLHFTKFTYGQYGNAFAQFLLENVFD